MTSMRAPQRAPGLLHCSLLDEYFSVTSWHVMKTAIFRGSFSAGHVACAPRPKAHCTTYITELQGQALCGLELSSAQVQVRGGSFQLLRDSQHLLRYVHLQRQPEMERAARILGEAHGNWLVAGHFLGALTRFKQSLISVLADVWEDVVKGNLHSRQATDGHASRGINAPPSPTTLQQRC